MASLYQAVSTTGVGSDPRIGEKMTEQTVALQLYTVRDETAKDFKQTLKYVAEMGYPAVEFAGYGNIASKDMATLLADFDLRAASTHVSLAALNKDLERELNYC